MLQLEFINAQGISMNALQNEYMTITGDDGLHGVDLELSSSTSPYTDGDNVNHMIVNPRSITLTYRLKAPIAESLDYFNSIVKTKQKATLIETRADGSKISVEGIVTVPPYTRVTNATVVQFKLHCSEPYWEDLEIIVEDISTIINLFYFPFKDETALQNLDGGVAFKEEGIPVGLIDSDATKVLYNNGDDSVGMIIEIVAMQTIINPRISKVGTEDNEFIGVNTTLNVGDWIRINTKQGEKSVVNADGELFDEVVYSGDDWLQLNPGRNELTITATNESGDTITSGMYFTIHYRQKYQ